MALLSTGRFVNPEILAAYRARLWPGSAHVVQYFRWLAAVTGDLGYSYTSAQPVLTMILSAWRRLVDVVRLFARCGDCLAAWRLDSAIFTSTACSTISARGSPLGIAMPVFWFCLILQLVFAVQLGWLPSSNRETVGDTG